MKIVFTYYPVFVRYNHGIAVLSSLCKQHGLETKIIPMDGSFAEKAVEFNPDYICASFVTMHDYKLAIPFIEKCKVPVLAGGVYLRKGGFVNSSLFKHICRGEGENIVEFFINGDTDVFDEIQLCEDISVLPLPDYSNINGDEFHRGYSFLIDKKIIPYSHSRGCPYKCSFCETQNLPSKVRIKTTTRQDIKILHDTFTPDLFFFMDELLPYYNQTWRDQFSGNRVSFFAYIRADINPQELQFLIDNGLSVCAFGIESGDEEYRNEILKKGLLDSQINETVNMLIKNDIYYIPFFMVGTPKETSKERNKTLEMFGNIGGYPVLWQYENLKENTSWVLQQQQ